MIGNVIFVGISIMRGGKNVTGVKRTNLKPFSLEISKVPFP
jgi:hypothetical protein